MRTIFYLFPVLILYSCSTRISDSQQETDSGKSIKEAKADTVFETDGMGLDFSGCECI